MKVTIFIVGAIALFLIAVFFLASYVKDVKKQRLPFGKRKR
ncbi:small membrane protein [Raoultella ornithinolytica]|nr:small membrane protein [Raoultella ornithinolytica]HEC2633863.1 small membrane protein [Raoultella ornithinolytica]